MTTLCRDCHWMAIETSTMGPAGEIVRCPACRSPRLVAHRELAELAIAHLDCDAFYASVEKRDDPSLADRPVIVGGGQRGVVSACCYIARMYGVRSAMPMFKALANCPDAVVIRPNMEKYRTVGLEIRRMMSTVTPMIEPLSIDEAFLDLTDGNGKDGTDAAPAARLADLATRVEREVGVTISVGLSYNKLLAKIASDLDKPRGFAVIGRAEAREFLADKPVGLLWGVGKALESRLAKDRIRNIGDLQRHDPVWLERRYGSMGRRLAQFARGEDERRVSSERETKSVSAETTFDRDIGELEKLEPRLWKLCERVCSRMAQKHLLGRTIVLKLKREDFQSMTRQVQAPAPTRSAEEVYALAQALLAAEIGPEIRFRLIGVGLSDLVDTSTTRETETLDLFADGP